VFGAASVLAPFCFAASLGALASGRVGVGAPVVPVWQACLNPASIAFGLVALAATAFSGASFLVGDARRYGALDLVEYFRRRVIVAAGAIMVLGAAALAVLAVESPDVFHGMLLGRGLPFTIAAVVATPLVAALMWRRVHLWYRALTVVAVGSFVFAWGFGQSPYLLPGRLTIAQAAGAPEVQLTLLVVAVIAVLIVTPSLALLYVLDQRNDLESPEEA
jgi:cytochrome d ubiquinol oxidase subunit II